MQVAMQMGDNQPHKHEYIFLNECGADVCMDCNDHKGLARCYCGWSDVGGNGYYELLDLGEQIEPSN